jgi:hypothetical protein
VSGQLAAHTRKRPSPTPATTSTTRVRAQDVSFSGQVAPVNKIELVYKLKSFEAKGYLSDDYS